MARRMKKWRSVTDYAKEVRLPSVSVKEAVRQGIALKNVQLSAEEIAKIERGVLNALLRDYMAGLYDILAARYTNPATYWKQRKSIRIQRPGSTALIRRNGRNARWNFVSGAVLVRDHRRVSLLDWPVTEGRHGLRVHILRGKGPQEIPGSFIAHRFNRRGKKSNPSEDDSRRELGTFRRNGSWYVNKRGWLRETITPINTTTGVEVLGPNGAERENVQRLSAQIGERMQEYTVKAIDRAVRRIVRKGKA